MCPLCPLGHPTPPPSPGSSGFFSAWRPRITAGFRSTAFVVKMTYLCVSLVMVSIAKLKIYIPTDFACCVVGCLQAKPCLSMDSLPDGRFVHFLLCLCPQRGICVCPSGNSHVVELLFRALLCSSYEDFDISLSRYEGHMESCNGMVTGVQGGPKE